MLENIEKYGVYSFETVEAMALSIKEKTNSNIAFRRNQEWNS